MSMSSSMYVYSNVSVFLCTCVYMYRCMRDVYMYVYMWACVGMCGHVCVHVDMSDLVRTHVCMYVCMYVCAAIQCHKCLRVVA